MNLDWRSHPISKPAYELLEHLLNGVVTSSSSAYEQAGRAIAEVYYSCGFVDRDTFYRGDLLGIEHLLGLLDTGDELFCETARLPDPRSNSALMMTLDEEIRARPDASYRSGPGGVIPNRPNFSLQRHRYASR